MNDSERVISASHAVIGALVKLSSIPSEKAEQEEATALAKEITDHARAMEECYLRAKLDLAKVRVDLSEAKLRLHELEARVAHPTIVAEDLL